MKEFRRLFIFAFIIEIFFLSGCTNNISATEIKMLIGKTAVITKNTFVYEQPNFICNNFQPLEKGNLVRILKVKNKKWFYIEPVSLGSQTNEGYVNIKFFSFDIKNNIPNQGYIKKENLFEKPDINSPILYKNISGAINIDKRENGWAYCSFSGGKSDAWIKESDISYFVSEAVVK